MAIIVDNGGRALKMASATSIVHLTESNMVMATHSDGSVSLEVDGNIITIPSEAFEDKVDVPQLIQLGLEKKEEVEKLVRQLWDKKC